MKTKHLLLSLVAMVATTGYMTAQTALIHELQLPYAVTNSIVREYAAPVDIVYAETSQGSYFVHNDHSGTPVVREINGTLSVSDFAIDNDTLFFCGNDLSGQVFFGYYNTSSISNTE